MGAFADGSQTRSVDAVGHEGGHDGLGALLAERIVDLVGARIVAVTLHFEVDRRIVLHDFRNTVDLTGRFGFDRSLAGIEGDGVSHDLAVGSQTVVERDGTLGDADILDEMRAGSVAVAFDGQPFGGIHVGDVDDPLLVDIDFQRPLVERNGDVMPFFKFDVAQFIITRPPVITDFPPITNGFVIRHLVPFDIGLRFQPELENVFPPILADLIGALQPEPCLGPPVKVRTVLLFPDFLVDEVGVELDGELLREIGLVLIEQRGDDGILIIEALLAVDLDNLRISPEDIPAGRELTELLVFHRIFKDDLIAGDEIVVVPFHLGTLLHLLLRSGSFLRCSHLLRHDIPGLLLILLLVLLLVVLLVFSQFPVEQVVDALLNFIADVLFGGVFRPVLEPVEHITLGIGAAADQQQRGYQQYELFHIGKTLIFVGLHSYANLTINIENAKDKIPGQAGKETRPSSAAFCSIRA